jgi:hypothetical protein
VIAFGSILKFTFLLGLLLSLFLLLVHVSLIVAVCRCFCTLYLSIQLYSCQYVFNKLDLT